MAITIGDQFVYYVVRRRQRWLLHRESSVFS